MSCSVHTQTKQLSCVPGMYLSSKHTILHLKAEEITVTEPKVPTNEI